MEEKVEVKIPRSKLKTKSKPKFTIQEELGIPDVVSEELLRKHQLEYILIKKYLAGFDILSRWQRGMGIRSEEQSALRRLAYDGLNFARSENYEKLIKDLSEENSKLRLEVGQLKGKMVKTEKLMEKMF